MSEQIAPSVSEQTPDKISDPFTEFVLWVIDQLRYDRTNTAGLVWVQIPESDLSAFDGRAELYLQIDSRGAASEVSSNSQETDGAQGNPVEQIEVVSPRSPLLQTLLNQLQIVNPIICSQPREQVNRLHQIAGRLFPAYSVLDGHIHLAGCSLEDRPFVRLTYLSSETSQTQAEHGSSVATLIHRYFDEQGNSLSVQRIAELGLSELVPAEETTTQLSESEFDRLVLLAKEQGVQQDPAAAENASSPHHDCEPIAQTVIWCKYAAGKLAVSVGENSAEFPFADWANLIQPEPLNCPQTGEPTHAFAVTGQGVIAAASQIARCSETGQRELKRDLVACSVSGKLALPERVVSCPVCEEPVLRSVLIECPICHQPVSPDVLSRGICRACAAPPRVLKSDARLARMLGEYPRLDQWSRWKLSETATVYIAQASSLLKHLLLVLNKQTLEVQHMATGSSLTRKWLPVPAEQWEGYLHSSDEED